MNVLEKLAKNKAIANLAFGQIKKHIKAENISLIAIFVDSENNVSGKEYKEPVQVIKQADFDNMKKIIQSLSLEVSELKTKLEKQTQNGQAQGI